MNNNPQMNKRCAGHVLRLPTPYEAAPPKEKRLLKRAGGSVSFLRNFGSTFNLSSGHHSGRKARVIGLRENILIPKETIKTPHCVRSRTTSILQHGAKCCVNPRIEHTEQQFRDDLNQLLSSLRISLTQDHSRTMQELNGQLLSKPRENRDHEEKKARRGAGFLQAFYLS